RAWALDMSEANCPFRTFDPETLQILVQHVMLLVVPRRTNESGFLDADDLELISSAFQRQGVDNISAAQLLLRVRGDTRLVQRDSMARRLVARKCDATRKSECRRKHNRANHSE